MNIPGIGDVTNCVDDEWYTSKELPIRVLGGIRCRIHVKEYDDDPQKEDFHVAIRNFLVADESVLRDAALPIYQYYLNCKDFFDPDGTLDIQSAGDVWKYVGLGKEPIFSRRQSGDKGIYVSLECGCEWEPEHGLEIVFKNGLKVNKVGPYDGCLTNSDAYGDDSLENVIFKSV